VERQHSKATVASQELGLGEAFFFLFLAPCNFLFFSAAPTDFLKPINNEPKYKKERTKKIRDHPHREPAHLSDCR
jgi:hypothetical protein